ncbi:MAG: VWA domain-containing protein [Elusimicrobia bacterium]|nr:VWA domain-containing protein [Elusimicrobiota bacterium]
MNSSSGALVSASTKSGYYDASASRQAFRSAEIIIPPSGYYQTAEGNTEEYAGIRDNAFKMVLDEALSTFSIDVDTASYSNLRRFLTNNQMPPKDAVRIEEMINYFSYDYPKPETGEPFSVTTNMAVCPWNTGHQLLMVGLKGKTPEATNLPPSNLVFLIDSSGSMNTSDKLPLLREGFKMMVRQLRPEDKVSIVVYAGSAGKVLEPTSGAEKDKIIAALDALNAGGSTAGGAGIQLAYQTAKEAFIEGGNNRVILATDGDFNVGVSSTSELERIIEEKRQDGIFLTVLGFGQGNLKDGRMESIADKGNGNYYYIDGIKEARKVLVTELGSTLFTIAKDVKIQIEFNPGAVKAYRLIGYENRMLAKEDFNDDKKDAGEIGAGHTVTALYEIVPADSEETFGSVDALKYQKPAAAVVESDEILAVKLRYKEPNEDTSKLIEKVVRKTEIKDVPTGDFAWAASIAEFGMLLRDSEHKGQSSYEDVLKRAKANVGEDKFGFREEFVTLVETAQGIAPAGNGQINFK